MCIFIYISKCTHSVHKYIYIYIFIFMYIYMNSQCRPQRRDSFQCARAKKNV